MTQDDTLRHPCKDFCEPMATPTLAALHTLARRTVYTLVFLHTMHVTY